MINEFMVPVVEKLAEHVETRFKTLEFFKIALRDDIDRARKSVRHFGPPYNVDFRGPAQRPSALPYRARGSRSVPFPVLEWAGIAPVAVELEKEALPTLSR
jgi:hypothetical protein